MFVMYLKSFSLSKFVIFAFPKKASIPDYPLFILIFCLVFDIFDFAL